MSSAPAIIEREPRDSIPHVIQQILDSDDTSTWSPVQDETGKIQGFRFTIQLSHTFEESPNGSLPQRVVWLFTDNHKIISKKIIMKVPTYNVVTIARNIIEGKRVFTVHRMSKANQCWELKAVLDDITVEWCYIWDVGTTLFPTLDKELDVDVSLLLPCQTIFKNIPFYKCYHPQKKEPSSLIHEITERIVRECQQNGYLLYQTRTSTNTSQSTTMCKSCRNEVCIWQENEDAVIKDNIQLYGTNMNVSRRDIAKLQFIFILNSANHGDTTTEIPDCILIGITTKL
jgi:hypothetical protein